MPPEFATFPLWAIVPGDPPTCACGDPKCRAIGKHPKHPYSQLGKGEQIAGQRGDGVGIATGERSGVFVLDFDSEEALEAMERDPTRPLPATYTVKTARGRHLYFRQPAGVRVKNSASELAPGVDVRGDGGFACGPGTVHKSGAIYTAVDPDAPIVDAPEWLLSWEGLARKERGEGSELDADENTAAWTLTTDDPRWRDRVALAAEKIASWPLPDTGEKGVRWRLCQFLTIDCALPVDVARDLLYADGYPDRCADWDEYHVVHSLKRALRNESDRVPGSVDMAGFQAKAEAFLAQQTEATREAKAVPVTEDAPHEYTFDPCNVVRELQYVEAEDGSKKAKKPYKPDFDEIVFDLNTEKDWAGVFRYNEFDNKIYAFRPPFRLKAEMGSARIMASDVSGLRVWFLNQKLASVKKEDVVDAVDMVAHANPYHPVRS
jgi:Bifunctional DNA primase/polymerase, N-terminal